MLIWGISLVGQVLPFLLVEESVDTICELPRWSRTSAQLHNRIKPTLCANPVDIHSTFEQVNTNMYLILELFAKKDALQLSFVNTIQILRNSTAPGQRRWLPPLPSYSNARGTNNAGAPLGAYR